MRRLVPIAAPLLGLAVALGIALIETGRDEGAPEMVAETTSATVGAGATVTLGAAPRSVRGLDEPFATDGHQWARGLLVGTNHPAAPAVAIADDGDLVVLTNGMGFQPDGGAFASVDFRPNPAGVPLEFHGGTFDLVLARFEADGSPVWGRSFGGPHDDFGGSVALAPNGDIFVSGTFEDGFDIGEGVMSVVGGRGRDAFVARFDGTGALRWVQTFATEFSESAGSLVALPDGGVVVFLTTDAPGIELGGTAIEFDVPERRALAVGLEADGAIARATPLDAAHASLAALDPSTGEIWVALSDVVEGGGFSARALVRMASDGSEVQRIPLPAGPDGTAGPLTVAAMAVDEDGSLVIGGRFEGQVSLGGELLVADGFDSPYDDGPMDGYVARFAADGTHLISRATGLPPERPSDGMHGLALTEEGDILIAGTSYLARLDSEGNLLAEVPFPEEPGATDGIPAGVSVSNAGNRASRVGALIPVAREDGDEDVLISGRFFDRLAFAFGGRILTRRGDDAFIVRVEAP